MKELKYILYAFTALALLLFNGCAEDVPGTEVIVSYPELILNGDNLVTVYTGETYEDPGAAASFGPEDVTDRIEVSGSVDENTPGVYVLTYRVSVENEIGEMSTQTSTRHVLVADEQIEDIDLSGTWVGAGFATTPSPQQISALNAPGWYSIPDVLSSGNGINVFFAFTGSSIVIPDQPTSFGNVNTTSSGTTANYINEGSFSWRVFVGCCGLFPDANSLVEWVRQ